MIVIIGIFISTIISVTSVNCLAINSNEANYEYQSWAPQKYVNYFVNPYVSANLKSGNDASSEVFLSFHKPVQKQDNFQISAKFVNEDGQVLSEVVKVMNLCDFLETEPKTNAPFSYSAILGMAGLRCPIIVGDVKEMIDVKPFKWPQQHNFAEKINCGVHNYHVTLYKCDNRGINCQKLIEAGVESLITSRHCDDDNGDEDDEMSDSPLVFDEDEDYNNLFYENDEMNEVNKMDEINNNMNVDKISATNNKILNAKIEQTETLDADLSTGQIIGTKSNKVAVVDGEMNQIKLVDSNSGHEVNIVDGKIDQMDLFDQQENAIEPGYGHKDNVYDTQPRVTVSQVSTKDGGIKHHETSSDILNGDRMQESQLTEDEITKAILKSVRVVAAQDGQRNTYDRMSGKKMQQNNINVVDSDMDLTRMY